MAKVKKAKKKEAGTEVPQEANPKIKIHLVPDKRFWVALAGVSVVLFVLFLAGLVSYWIYVTRFA